VRRVKSSPVTFSARSSGGRYAIRVEPGALRRLGSWIRDRHLGERAVVVSDATVAALYAPAALRSLERAGIDATLVSFPPGERSKNLRTLERLYEQFVDLGVDRDSLVIALGGGVVGDVAGFVAATYLRGLPLVHVPTTVLAQADSAIGGKTGVDLPRGKNLVGAFYAPRLVVIDPVLVATLPPREARAGLAEVAKVAMALDARLFRHLERHADELANLDSTPLVPAIVAAARAKAKIVSEDERDRGRRRILNYGHTVGHALEALGGYRRWLHGEAVALGMRAAARVSVLEGRLSAADEARQGHLLDALGLDAAFPRVSIGKLFSHLELDKKSRRGEVAFVLTAGVGVARFRRNLSREVLVRALTSLGAKP
jgi:3-dehydroquinate synthase